MWHLSESQVLNFSLHQQEIIETHPSSVASRGLIKPHSAITVALAVSLNKDFLLRCPIKIIGRKVSLKVKASLNSKKEQEKHKNRLGPQIMFN